MSQVRQDDKVIERVIERHSLEPSSLIAVLQDIQEELHYLPEEALRNVADSLHLPLTQVFEVATFYNAFSLTPKGKYVIQVCTGTACHVRGASAIVEEAERVLGINRGDTTEDEKFTLETVNCLGACALGPVMVINGNYHGHLTPDMVKGILQDYK